MAARTPRRSFATPFVVTLAAVPACYVQSSPQPQPQPVQQAQPVQQPNDSHPMVVTNPPRPQPTDSHPAIITNPPRPQPESSPMPQQPQQWQVWKTADGCEASAKIDCPQGAMCNPPPPHKVDCPPNIVMNKPITIVSQSDGTCIVAREMPSCPPHAMCNPPRPQVVACPK